MKKSTRSRIGSCRQALSLLELLAVVTLMGIIAVIAVPRLTGSSNQTRANACFSNVGTIEVQAQLWRRNKGSAPAANLDDIMSDATYFPDGPVVCPIDQSEYTLDRSTLRVDGHTHTSF